jgi:phosphatidate cytidylyltransferase
MVIFLMTVSMVGPLGDLFESALKRTGGVKDSGSIIPGHGGIFDRIDALMFVAPVAYVFKTYLLT